MNMQLAGQHHFMAAARRMATLFLLALSALFASVAFAQNPAATAPVITPPITTPVVTPPGAAVATPPPAVAAPAPAKPAPVPRIEFNHNQTGYQLTGAHILARCETCHLQGIFKGTPKDCASCHISGGRAANLNTVLKPTDHISVIGGSLCETCHLSTSEFTVWRMDHTLTTAACSSCHSGQSFNGTVFTAKGPQHISTVADCKTCHISTSSFLPPFVSRFDHIDVVPGTCATCHNGATAVGKPPAHMPVGSRACDDCHVMPLSGDITSTFATWHMDHTGITSNCAQCHNGKTFVGVKNSQPLHKPTNHIPVTSDCSVCHFDTTVPGGFVNWSQPMDHSAAAIGTAACATCHGAGKSFIGSPIVVTLPTAAKAHIPTTATCDTCHYKTHVQPYTSFTNWTMDHTGITSGCQSCHGSTQTGDLFAGVMSQNPGHVDTSAAGTNVNAKNKPDCSSCHPSTAIGGFAQFKSGIGFVGNPHGGGMPFNSISVCKDCHNGVAAPGMVAGHIAVNSGADCSACHGNGTSALSPSFLKLTLTPGEHASVSSTCATCHLSGKSYPGLNPPIKTQSSVNHITISAGASCTACHDATNFTSFGGRTWTANMMDHSAVSTTSCNQCHAKPANSSFTSTPPLTIKTTSNQAYNGGGAHIPVTGDCAVCHSKLYAAGDFSTSWTMGTTGHSAVNTGTCSGCHAKAVADYTFAPSVAVIGSQTTSGTYSGNPWHTLTGNAPTSDCTSCHGSLTTFLGATSAHKHTAADAGQCSTCHGGSGGGGKTKVASHVATSASCDVCHTTWNTAGNLANETGVFAACSTNPKTCMGAAGHAAVTNPTPCSGCHLESGNQSITGGTATVTVVGLVSGHIGIVTGAACDTCHGKVYTSFARTDWKTAMNHGGSVIASTPCATCHSAGVDKTYPTGIKVLGALTTPPPAGTTAYHTLTGNAPTSDCSDCHGSTTTFAGAAGHTHAASDAGKCNTCHTGSGGGKIQITGHILTAASCDVCHTTWTASYANETGVFAACSASPKTCMGAAGHAAVSATCASCHLAAGNQSIVGGTTAVTVVGLASPHIPINSGASCVACHDAANFSTFARTWTASLMSHASVSTGTCNTCHKSPANTSFASTTPLTIRSLATGHIPVTGDCADCHKLGIYTASGFTQSWTATSMNHNAVNTGTCNVCHPASAPFSTYPTGVNVIGALTTSYTGTGVTFPWHTGSGGTPTTDCSGCHQSFATFGGASNHVHTSADNLVCLNCHNGTGGGKTKPAGHVGTTANCYSCHTNYLSNLTFVGQNTGWVMGPAGHAALTTPTACNSCHTGQSFPSGVTPVAKGTSPPHITVSASLQCSSCHNTANNTTTFANVPVFTPAMHVANGNTTSCIACHGIGGATKAFQGVSPKAQPAFGPGGHITTVGSDNCTACHTTSASSSGTFSNGGAMPSGSGWTMGATQHGSTYVTVPCSSCHNGQVFATGVTPKNKTNTTGGTHINMATFGMPSECSACHTSTTAFTTVTMTNATAHGSFKGQSSASVISTVTNSCAACHSSNLNAGFELGSKITKKTLGNHEKSTATQDCVSSCHHSVKYTSW